MEALVSNRCNQYGAGMGFSQDISFIQVATEYGTTLSL